MARAICCAVLPVALAPAAAATAAAPPDAWLELQTAHFAIAGNGPERGLRDTAQALEEFAAALAALYPEVDALHPTRVVVFKDARQFARFLPRDEHGRTQPNVSAYFLPFPDAGFIVLGRPAADADHRLVLHDTRTTCSAAASAPFRCG